MTKNYNLDYKIDFILKQLENPSAYYQRLATAIKSLPAGDIVDVYALKFDISVSSRKEANDISRKEANDISRKKANAISRKKANAISRKEANDIKKKYKDYQSLPWE